MTTDYPFTVTFRNEFGDPQLAPSFRTHEDAEQFYNSNTPADVGDRIELWATTDTGNKLLAAKERWQ